VFFTRTCDGCGVGRTGTCVACLRALSALPRPTIVAPEVDFVHHGFVYQGVVRELIIGLKYRNHRPNAGLLVDALVDRLESLPAVDVVTWAPTTRARARRRGADHAELLARRMGRRLGVPVRRLLCKTSDGAQTGRSRRQRMVGPTIVARPFRGAPRVMVVDDVVTTGTTLERSRAALIAAGAVAVVCVAIAATPAPEISG
jgi:predicted amidophosphoribosyltransferase